jgi:CRISPR system Cascade subunit CasD
MIPILLLRLEAPLMSFGGVAIDYRGVTRTFPGRAMLTGLLANALGYEHREFARLEALQFRLAYAARADRPGALITDFQTVDLSQPFLSQGWTTRGAPQGREGGSASKGTHIRLRQFLADAVITVALTLNSPGDDPSLAALESALRDPARPLYIGRKPCIPSVPVLLDAIEASSLIESLEHTPRGLVFFTDGRSRKGRKTVGRKVHEAALFADICAGAQMSIALPVASHSAAIAMFRLVLEEYLALGRLRENTGLQAEPGLESNLSS